MKKIAMITLAALALAGCQITRIKRNDNGELEASITSHWLQREVNKCEIEKTAEGYKFILNGYKSDASEQLPAFTREMLSGLAIFGRLAAATINPTVGTVPLTAEGADAEAIAKIQQSLATAKAEATKAKAEATKAKAELKQAQAELEKAKQTQTEPLPECEGDECVYEE